ncbi:hypothetical protein [Streptomyces sp. NPDC088348]|uniref:hypothetical protein n=1 Tax=Streptomyces sp. NPDC088348 TaxID=3365853 RepID=UPI0037F9F706
MPKSYHKEFREDVVRVARNREHGVTLEQVAADSVGKNTRLTRDPGAGPLLDQAWHKGRSGLAAAAAVGRGDQDQSLH